MTNNSGCNCTSGLLLPILDECGWNQGFRAFLYLAGLLYSFLGVAIAADVFMCAIERITSTTKKIRLPKPQDLPDDDVSDVVQFREVYVWNPTVANLTLMALGSSAPEILLSCIEIAGNNFQAGELGPSTIVGSAAFNLLLIIGVCVISIPSGGKRRIQEIMVFAVTASFSIFAYIWLLLILVVFSPNVVEVWEGTLTLFYFIVLIVIAYSADRKFCMSKRVRRGADDISEKGVAIQDGAENSMMLDLAKLDTARATEPAELMTIANWREVEREVTKAFPHLTPSEIARIVAFRIQEAQPHDRMFWRIRAVRWLSSSSKSNSYWDPTQSKDLTQSASMSQLPGAPSKRIIEFSSRVYGANKDTKRVVLTVVRRGRNTKPLYFRYETVNGVAKKNEVYLPKSETLVFEAGETKKNIIIELVDNAQWKVKDVFYVRLHIVDDDKTKVGKASPAEIQFVDPEAQPVIEFAKNHAAVHETHGTVRIPVIKRGGVAQSSTVNYSTLDGTAEAGKDYDAVLGTLTFAEGEVEKYIDIAVIDDMEEEKDETFQTLLDSPSTDVSLGYQTRCVVTIISDDGTFAKFRAIEHLVPTFIDSLKPGTVTWKDQIVSATSVNGGDVENATLGDCVLHILAFPWKAIFAFVPPPVFFGGWLTFIVALMLIGLLTAVVGDLASIFGCLVGLKNSITAITLVAVGTSLPDTFASRLAAVQDDTADNSIGNVTGSNSVNIFLGLGLPWFIASVYWASKGKEFRVEAGTLGFSVTVYTACALLCIGVIMARRYLSVFGKAELGGPSVPKWLTFFFLVFLWFLYVLLSALQAYGYISGF